MTFALGFFIGFIVGAAAVFLYAIYLPAKFGKVKTEIEEEVR